MGEGSEGTAASSSGSVENNALGSCEAHHVASRPPKNRGVSASKVGKVEGAAEEGGVADRHTEGGKPQT
jgi:hypothetical protein